MNQTQLPSTRRARPNRIDGEKLVVRLARPSEEEWLARNHAYFEEPLLLLGFLTSKETHPVFILLKGKEIIGYRKFYLKFPPSKSPVAYGNGMSLRRGYERKGLGPLLDGRSKALLHSLGYKGLHIAAHDIDAKRFWVRQGYAKSGGKPLNTYGTTDFFLNLKKERERKSQRVGKKPRVVGRKGK